MNMKIPNGSGNGYYGHDSSIISYLSDSSDIGNGDDVDSPTLDGDFSEYMWMENEEEFDKQVSCLLIEYTNIVMYFYVSLYFPLHFCNFVHLGFLCDLVYCMDQISVLCLGCCGLGFCCSLLHE